MVNEKELNIEVSSTTLGYEGKGGNVGAFIAFGEELMSKDRYTDIVVSNALEFKKETEKIIPNTQFGVSILASAINPKRMKGLISSIDYPYSIKWGMNFIKEKIDSSYNGRDDLEVDILLAQDLAYAMLQSGNGRAQERSTIRASEYIKNDPIKIRTCIHTVSIENELKKIKEVNSKILDKGKNVIWVIEPNKRIGDGTLDSFLNILDEIQKSNPSLKFGIDLDIGGLVKEQQSLLQVLDKLDSNNLLPVYISLSGKEETKDNVRTHLPLNLGHQIESNILLGKWLHNMQFRGKKIPGIVIETNPSQEDTLDDYVEFLKKLKIYY